MKVSFNGGFWNKHGHKGEEIKIGRTFTWGKEKWSIPSVYLCDEGLVIDYCVEISLNDFKALDISFRSDVICNDIALETESGCSISWIPSSCQTDEYTCDDEVRKIVKYYELDPESVWIIWRVSYGWSRKENHIDSLEIGLKRNRRKVIGEPVGNLKKGDSVEIRNPVSGEKHRLNVYEIIDEDFDASVFSNPGIEYPTHYKTMSYRIDPEPDNVEYALQDNCEGDHPKGLNVNSDGPMAVAVSVIGGTHGLAGGKLKIVNSSMHFDKEFDVEWIPVFFVKDMRDLIVRYESEQMNKNGNFAVLEVNETRYKADPKQPYGLHDYRISDMRISDENLHLIFENGFAKVNGPEVKGSIVIEGIDSDFCKVIVQGNGGEMGGFRGEKLTIDEFTAKYRDFSFEVIDEYYGWHRLQLTGWLWMPNKKPKDVTLSLGYFRGDIVYKEYLSQGEELWDF